MNTPEYFLGIFYIIIPHMNFLYKTPTGESVIVLLYKVTLAAGAIKRILSGSV